MLLVIWVHVLKLRPIFLGVQLFAAIVGPEAHFSGVLSCLLQL